MKKVLFSFDIEEFDMPMEYGKDLTLDEQIRISAEGTKIVLDILRDNKISATFFSTVVFATHAPELIKRIISEGHELASHGYFHSRFELSHLQESKVELERLSGKKVTGFRMARMKSVDDSSVQKAGYVYNSSLNPVYLPGRYNNFFKPRKVFKANGLINVPASATPIVRFPLFWLSFHNLPLWIYKLMCSVTIRSDKYLNIYFHPWEFVDLTPQQYGLPDFASRNSGDKMAQRFTALASWMKEQGYTFGTMHDFVEQYP